MEKQARWHWARRPVGVLAALLAAWLLAPSAADASCGDYVLLGSKAHAADAVAHPPQAPFNTPRPCSGPLCSRHTPSLPVVPPAAPPSERAEQWSCLSVLPPAEQQASVPLGDGPSCRPVRAGCSVYHPPRPF